MPPASLQTQMGLEHLAAIPPDVSMVACFVSLLLPSAQLLLTPLTPSVSTSPEGQGVGRFRAVRKSAGQKGGLAAEVSCGGPTEKLQEPGEQLRAQVSPKGRDLEHLGAAGDMLTIWVRCYLFFLIFETFT